MRQKYLWMAVEADEYELPIAIGDTAKELGEMLGTSKKAVENFVYYGYGGERSGIRIVKVRIEDDERFD